MKIYTRTGDKGQTSLFGGTRVSKSNLRVVAYGTLDELNAQLGLAIVSLPSGNSTFDEEKAWLTQVQRELFAMGSWLASPKVSESLVQGTGGFTGDRAKRTNVTDQTIETMEAQIDQWEKSLVPMDAFILPGGSPVGAQVHVCRTVCRRAEREIVLVAESGEAMPELVVRYVNRLADALFVLARYLNFKMGSAEVKWE